MRQIVFLFTLVSAATLQGQDSQSSTAPQVSSTEQEKALAEKRRLAAAPPPITLREKYKYTLTRSFGPQEMVVMTAGGGLDQWDRHPDEWGEGWDAYGVRVASHFGQSL